VDFSVLPYSASGNVSNSELYILSTVQACNPASFQLDLIKDKVVVVPNSLQTSCSIYNVTLMAEDAGAAGVLVYNDKVHDFSLPLHRVRTVDWRPTDRFVKLPVIGISSVLGQVLLSTNVTVMRVSLSFKTQVNVVDTFTLIAESLHGNEDEVIAMGAHLDSTPTSPGMNDNGSGAAALLTIAEAIIGGELKPSRRTRFYWWGGGTEGWHW